MIDFERPPQIEERLEFVRRVAAGVMRPQARHYDDHEHEIPWEFVRLMWEEALRTGQSFRSGAARPEQGPGLAAQTIVHLIEMQSWGDAGIYLCTPGAGLGGAAVEATGTPEQKARFLA
ncbi:MAG TPA: acyl-CoA dehydrogenase family protein, partial [Vicinamibacteria bacterium]